MVLRVCACVWCLSGFRCAVVGDFYFLDFGCLAWIYAEIPAGMVGYIRFWFGCWLVLANWYNMAFRFGVCC